MSIIFLLIPLGLLLVAIAVWAFVWAVNHEQFEDLDKAARSILYDDDEAAPERAAVEDEPRAPRRVSDLEDRRDTEA